MYVPSINKITDQEESIAFIQRFNFGTIINSQDDKPVATHLPFLLENTAEGVKLISHFARANPQWKLINSTPALVIFTEPHAYIAPKHYEKELNVPTWNYLAVHAYGQGRTISETLDVMEVLEKTISFYDKDYAGQWAGLPEDYKLNMAKGIVAFEVVVTELQGKKKLSQNKTATEQRNIISSLEKSSHSNEALVAEYMRAEKQTKKD